MQRVLTGDPSLCSRLDEDTVDTDAATAERTVVKGRLLAERIVERILKSNKALLVRRKKKEKEKKKKKKKREKRKTN